MDKLNLAKMNYEIPDKEYEVFSTEDIYLSVFLWIKLDDCARGFKKEKKNEGFIYKIEYLKHFRELFFDLYRNYHSGQGFINIAELAQALKVILEND